MADDLLLKLSEFGFTINQAKVYLSIVESGLISVGDISKNTQLYVQDIYKILPKLEKMGLITKTIDKPVLIKAIPVEKALNRLVTVEKREANQRISRLEANLKEITSEIIQHQNTMETPDDTLFIPLTTDEQIKNRLEETFEKANIECDLVLNLDLIIHSTQGLRENFELLRKVKTRIIIETVEKESRVKKIVEKTLPKSNDFQIKIIHKTDSIPYYIVDDCELWFSMKKKTASGLPCMLWSNSRNIVDFFVNCFNESWKSQKATSIQISKI